jgi:hypothetical protein
VRSSGSTGIRLPRFVTTKTIGLPHDMHEKSRALAGISKSTGSPIGAFLPRLFVKRVEVAREDFAPDFVQDRGVVFAAPLDAKKAIVPVIEALALPHFLFAPNTASAVKTTNVNQTMCASRKSAKVMATPGTLAQ